MMRRLFILAFGAAFFAAPVRAQSIESLAGQWLLNTADDASYADPELDDSRWTPVTMPSNLTRSGVKPGEAVWLRHRFQLTPTEVNLVLQLGPVYDTDQTYINGELIGQTGTPGMRSTPYARPRIYPIPSRILKSGENVIAIRLVGSFKGQIGITNLPVRIAPASVAEWTLWSGELKSLTYAAIYLVSGVFFALLHFRIGGRKEYIWYGALAGLFFLQQFTRSEYRFLIADQFFLFKMIEQICYVMLPTAFFFFFAHFFHLDLKTAFKFDRFHFKHVEKIYPGINALAAVGVIVSAHPVIWDRIITSWFYINIPFFAYYLYVALKHAFGEWQKDAMIFAAGLALMVLATAQYYASERGLIGGPSDFAFGVLIFNLFLSMALIFRLINLQLEVQERQDRLNEVHEMRDRVFGYLNTFIKKPADALAAKALALVQPDLPVSERGSLLSESHREIDALQANLDDILELSRLEVIPEPEYLEEVNFNDFITAVVPQGAITSHIKVHPDIVLKTSLELVNSMVIRLIDFPGFKLFKQIDLIITSDLRNNVHFRFLLVHPDFRQTRKLYELITSLNPERGTLWVKWAIIREIIRILDGDMKVNILNRKFLRIDITLRAELPAALAEKSTAAAPLAVSYISPVAEALPIAGTAAAVPRLSTKMTVSDLSKYLRAQISSIHLPWKKKV